jgi:hypothetical protein
MVALHSDDLNSWYAFAPDAFTPNTFMCYINYSSFDSNQFSIQPDSVQIVGRHIKCVGYSFDCMKQHTFRDLFAFPNLYMQIDPNRRHQTTVGEPIFLSIALQFEDEWNGAFTVIPNCIRCDADSTLVADTLHLFLNKDSLLLQSEFDGRRITWAEVYKARPMETFDRKLARQMIKQWLLTLNTNEPFSEAIHALDFKLQSSPEGYYTLILTDSGRLLSECPHLKISTRNARRQVLEGISEALKKLSHELKQTQLMQGRSVSVGFADDNLFVINSVEYISSE